MFVAAYFCYLYNAPLPWIAATSGIGASLVATSVASWLLLLKKELADEVYALGIISTFVERNTDIPGGEWTKMIQNAKRRCNILGVALHGYIRDPDTEHAIKTCVANKVHVNILFLNPKSYHATLRNKEETRDTLHDITESIVHFWGIRNRLSPDEKRLLSLRTYEKTPTCSITWIDSHMVITNYIAPLDNVRAPGFIVRDASPTGLPSGLPIRLGLRLDKRCFFDIYADTFRNMLNESRELTQEDIDCFEGNFLKG